MFKRLIRPMLLSAIASLAITSAAAAQDADTAKVAFFYFEGPANATGSLDLRIVPRDADCSGSSIASVNQAYDDAVGGDPTTAEELRNSVFAALVLPPGYVKQQGTIGGNPSIAVTSYDDFDVCVEGVRILGDGVTASASENGITVTGSDKSKNRVPGASPAAMALIAAVIAGAGVLMLRRRAEA